MSGTKLKAFVNNYYYRVYIMQQKLFFETKRFNGMHASIFRTFKR